MHHLVTYLVYIAVIVRAIGWNHETSPIPTNIWILLGIFGIFLIFQELLTRYFPRYPQLYILIQSAITVAMLYSAPELDFLSMLFLPLCFQIVQFFPSWIGFTWIGVIVLVIAGRLLVGLEWQAGLTMVLTAGGMGFLMGSFAFLINRTGLRQQENQRLFAELQSAYHQLKDSASQAEALATATERHRLVRELHDSLTQTLFSMNLAVQAAQFSIGEDPAGAIEHLTRLQNLTRSAIGEVQALMGRAPHWSLARGGLQVALRNLANERLEQDGLEVIIEAAGTRDLPEQIDLNLYRIVQEALNNITRHAGVRQALVRLCLDGPTASLEIIDHGCGFDTSGMMTTGGIGLAGMAGRAREIGWELEVRSKPGEGTHICVQEKTE